MSWLYTLNRAFLQWFFIRLARVVDEDTDKQTGWTVLRWVVPETGWGKPYKFIGR